MGIDSIDVRRDDVRLELVALDLPGVTSVVDRPDHLEQGRDAVGPPLLGERSDEPECGVGILPAVLTHACDIPLDVAGVVFRVLEGGREEPDDSVSFRHELFFSCAHCVSCAVRGSDSREDGPGLCESVDLALVALLRSQRCAVVVVAPLVPVTVPAGGVERRHQVCTVRFVAGRALGVPSRQDVGQERIEDADEEEPHPDTLSGAADPDPVHAVVPIPGAEERKPVRTQVE